MSKPATTAKLTDAIADRGLDNTLPTGCILDEAVILTRLIRKDGTTRIALIATDGIELITLAGLLDAAKAITRNQILQNLTAEDDDDETP